MRGVTDPFNRMPFKEDRRDLYEYYVNLSRLRNENPALSTGEAVFGAVGGSVLTILRYVNCNKDVFGLPAENSAFLTVINMGTEPEEISVDCTAAGCGTYCGTIPGESAKIIRLG